MAVDTPKKSRAAPVRKYNDAEKQAILNNFDVEMEGRRNRFQARLEENLEDFQRRHRHLINNIPRVLQDMTVEEFATKYDGSIHRYMDLAVKAKAIDGVNAEIEASARKRKQLSENGEGPLKSSKTARKAPPSPTKPSEVDATPKAARTFLPARTPGKAPPSALSRARFASATQPIAGPSRQRQVSSSSNQGTTNSPKKVGNPSAQPPSLAAFNPTIPKTPAYPPKPRPVQQNDTILSANGSPLANPWKQSGATSTIVEGDDSRDRKPLSLNSPSTNRSATFSFRSRSGLTLVLDPSRSPGKTDELAHLTDSAKKEVRDSVLRLAQRYGALAV